MTPPCANRRAGGPRRPLRRGWATAAAAAVLAGWCGAATGCGTVQATLSNGSVTGCYRALPAAVAALHQRDARLLGVHRLPVDHLPPRIRAAEGFSAEADTTICAVAFRGNFAVGQVTGARPGASGAYAVVVIDARHVKVLGSYVGAQLPKALKGKTV